MRQSTAHARTTPPQARPRPHPHDPAKRRQDKPQGNGRQKRNGSTTSKKSREIHSSIIRLMPALRAFTVSLTRNPVEADDLAQETLLKALDHIDQFVPGTNLKAWLFTIARNTFCSSYRKRSREPVCDLLEANGISVEADQDWTLRIKAVREALHQLPDDQEEALMLVGGAGLTYIEAAEVCGCALGTVKSRVSRGRARLLGLLEAKSNEEFLQSDDGK